VATNTITIVPNSLMADKRIENVSRGKKIVAMICLDFLRILDHGERALVKEVVQEASQVFWGFNKASIHVQFCTSDQQSGTRARVIFFISSVDDSSLGLRKRLLELANSSIAHKLAAYNLKFTTPEPVVYIDSPMSL
jgi:MscS family membrane protein